MKTKTVTENIKKVLEFDKECEHNGQKLSTRYCTLITLHNLCQFAGKKPFKLFTRADLINFLDMAKHRKFQDTRYRARTKNVERVLVDSSMNHVKYQIKRLFQWMNGMRDKEYPETVSWNDNGFVLTTHVHKSKSKRTGRIPLCMR